jgi:hypothetical protein
MWKVACRNVEMRVFKPELRSIQQPISGTGKIQNAYGHYAKLNERYVSFEQWIMIND